MITFDDFWRAYPRRVAKEQARKTWAKLHLTPEEGTAIIEALAWQVEQEQWTRAGGQFIPHPSTWLNRCQWQDERPVSGPHWCPHAPPHCARTSDCTKRTINDERVKRGAPILS